MTKADEGVPVRVLRAAGTRSIADAMQQATHNAAVGRCLVVAGVVFLAYRTSTHPLAWQVSLSHWGRPPVVVSRHQIKRDAKAQVARVRRICRTRDLRDVAVFAALIQELAAFSDGTVE